MDSRDGARVEEPDWVSRREKKRVGKKHDSPGTWGQPWGTKCCQKKLFISILVLPLTSAPAGCCLIDIQLFSLKAFNITFCIEVTWDVGVLFCGHRHNANKANCCVKEMKWKRNDKQKTALLWMYSYPHIHYITTASILESNYHASYHASVIVTTRSLYSCIKI